VFIVPLERANDPLSSTEEAVTPSDEGDFSLGAAKSGLPRAAVDDTRVVGVANSEAEIDVLNMDESLVAKKLDGSTLPSVTSPTQLLAQPKDREALRILLAEDNVINQRLTAKVLKKMGYPCDVVSNGREAVDAVKEREFDVVLMDLNMPQLNGFEASIEIHEFIKNHPTRHGPTVIALTASGLGSVRDECERAHMKGFLSKPLSVDELRAVLARFAREKSAKSHEQSAVKVAETA
jgi:CheY-like chemotaxis protein